METTAANKNTPIITDINHAFQVIWIIFSLCPQEYICPCNLSID